jgi:hypothetical protein
MRRAITIASTLLLVACPALEEPQESGIVSVGAFFGECLGACRITLELAGDDLLLRIDDWTDAPPLAEQHGTLTPAGRKWRDEIAHALLERDLDPVYGCPDCDDSGGMRLVLDVGPGSTEHTWEHGNPPAVLADVDRMFHELRDALERCESSDDIDVSSTCEPVVR